MPARRAQGDVADSDQPEPQGREFLRLPSGEDLWVFGYGSLIWNPGFPHLEVRRARLFGYHRRLCIYSHVYRGTPKRPGLVFGLDRGGSCEGLAFRVPESEGPEVLEYLYGREMVTQVYIPRWLRVRTSKATLLAAGFVVDRAHHQYTGRLSLDETVRFILQGEGTGGTNTDYLVKTVHHLDALGLADGTLRRLLRAVEARG